MTSGVRILLPLAVLLAGGIAHAFFAQPHWTSVHAQGTDDAYISFRYAENLANGHGLTYNRRDAVEGYSNLLHVLIAAALFPFVGRDGIFAAVSVVNLLWLAVAFVVFHRLVRRRLGDGPALAAAWLFALSPPLWIWAGSGMETIGVLLLQLSLWSLVDSWDEEGPRYWLLASVLALIVFARADGFVVVALAAAFHLWRRQPRRALTTAALAAPYFALHLVWRWFYYGRPLPNTYYAKVAGTLVQRVPVALEFGLKVVLFDGLVLYLLVVVGRLLRDVLRASPERRVSFGPFLAVGLMAYWIAVGGDHFGDRRFLVLIPAGIVGLLEVGKRLARPARIALFLLAALLPLLPLTRATWYEYRGPWEERYDGWITLGRHLGDRAGNLVLAAAAAGKIPFFSGMRTIDMWGLTDERIGNREVDEFRQPGHTKMDPRGVLERRPHLIAVWLSLNLDAGAGLKRELYEVAGYRLVLLVNTTAHSREKNLVDVRGRRPAAVQDLVRDGYRLGVLAREPEPDLAPRR